MPCQEPLAYYLYIHSVISEQGVVQADTRKVVALGHQIKAASRKYLPLQSLATKLSTLYFTAAALHLRRVTKQLRLIDTQVNGQYFMQLHRLYPLRPIVL